MAIDKTSLKVMNRLFDKGYTTEKAVAAFNLEDVCVIECYAPAEIARIIALKEAVKANKVISFLSGQQEKQNRNDHHIKVRCKSRTLHAGSFHEKNVCSMHIQNTGGTTDERIDHT